MGIVTDTFEFMTGMPAMIGLILTAVSILLTAEWRLSLTALLVQYVLVGLTLTRFVQAELAVVKILVGVLVVSILYLSARHTPDARDSHESATDEVRSHRLHLEWWAGPLGLPLRILTVIMVALAGIHFFDDYRALLPVLDGGRGVVPADMAFISLWLAEAGLMGLILSSDPLRVAPALLTVLTAFDLVYVLVEPSVAVVGLVATVTLMSALAFAYLTTIRGLRDRVTREGSGAEVLPVTMRLAVTGDEDGD